MNPLRSTYSNYSWLSFPTNNKNNNNIVITFWECYGIGQCTELRNRCPRWPCPRYWSSGRLRTKLPPLGIDTSGPSPCAVPFLNQSPGCAHWGSVLAKESPTIFQPNFSQAGLNRALSMAIWTEGTIWGIPTILSSLRCFVAICFTVGLPH